MTEPVTTVVPRRVGPVARVLVAALVGVPLGALAVPVLFPEVDRELAGPVVAVGLAAMSLAIVIALNYGFAPRVRGSVLEVRTLLGRQTVDLAALVTVGHQQLTWKSRPRLLLGDPANTVSIRPPRGQVRDAVARAVWEAPGRGVMVAPDAPPLLGLPPLPGMMDRSASLARDLAVHGGVMVGLCLAGALGTLLVLLRG